MILSSKPGRIAVVLLLSSVLTLVVAEETYAQADGPPLWEELFLVFVEPVRYGDAAWGDFDGDGDFDLIYSGSLTEYDNPTPYYDVVINIGEASRLKPNPDGGEPVEVYGINYNLLAWWDIFVQPVWRSMAAWGDLNNDGQLDVIISGIREQGQKELQIYFQTPPGESREFFPLPIQPGLSDGDLVVADIDNDGDQDILISGYDQQEAPQTWILENTIREGGFLTQKSHNIANLGLSDFAVGDYDGDQDMDILITGIAEPQRFVTQLYRNDGTGNFSATADQFKPLYGAAVDWGDSDGDGDLDILYSGGVITPFILEGDISVYENIGTSFSRDGVTIYGRFEGDPVFGTYRGSAEWGDFNNDGFLDFILAGSQSAQQEKAGQTYQNLQNNTFRHSMVGLHGRFPGGLFGSAFWGDYDGDNDLDILSLGYDGGHENVAVGMRNFLPEIEPNLAPDPPALIEAEVVGAGRVKLSWTEGSDSRTPTAALSYNIRIGSAPGLQDVVTAMSTSDSGLRHVAARGNAENNLTWTISGLAAGTYYWSVQSIDSSFIGSAFAIEGTFTVTP